MGWSDFFRDQLTPEELHNAVIARVVEPLRGLSRVACSLGEIWGECSDNLGVGDWVVGTTRGAVEKEARLTITRVLNRKTKLSRTAPSGKNYEQILCANADVVFIVVAMTQNLHLPGIERALIAADQGSIPPVIVLTKSDACDDPAAVLALVKSRFNDTPIHAVSVARKEGLQTLDSYFESTKLVVLLGASGAGKSTLTNYYLGTNAQLVSETRESDEKGRHTTTARRLHFLPTGAMIVDSPGIRELQPWKEPEIKAKEGRPKGPRPPKRSTRFYDEDDN